MDKIELLEEKIKSAVKMISDLKQKNLKLDDQYEKLTQENQLLHSENTQARKVLLEMDRLREEHKLVRQKLERLLDKYNKVRL